jgi:hypothetical protein
MMPTSSLMLHERVGETPQYSMSGSPTIWIFSVHAPNGFGANSMYGGGQGMYGGGQGMYASPYSGGGGGYGGGYGSGGYGSGYGGGGYGGGYGGAGRAASMYGGGAYGQSGGMMPGGMRRMGMPRSRSFTGGMPGMSGMSGMLDRGGSYYGGGGLRGRNDSRLSSYNVI